jgi:hypothetical protein
MYGANSHVYRCWWWNLEERDHMEDLGVYGRTILKYIFDK